MKGKNASLLMPKSEINFTWKFPSREKERERVGRGRKKKRGKK